MSYTKNKDLLEEINQAVKLLRTEQNKTRDKEDDEQLHYLADYFQKREKLISETIGHLKEDVEGEEGETYNQFEASDSPVEMIETHLPSPNETEGFITWNLKRQEELAAWCDKLSEKAKSKKIPDIFGNLAEQLRTLNRQLAAETRSIEQG